MIIANGNSYCVECRWNPAPFPTNEEAKKREDEALEGLSALFG